MGLIKTVPSKRAEVHPTASVTALSRRLPSAEECETILADWWVEGPVIRHSRKVAELACKIAAALLHCGVEVNPELVQSAALLHDLAKGRPNHALVGASILRGMGLNAVAEVVAVHTDLGEFSALDEAAIVYLADKLVRGDQQVTIAERFEPALKRFRTATAALDSARKRLKTAIDVAAAVEECTGMPLARLLRAESGVHAHRCCAVALRARQVEMA